MGEYFDSNRATDADDLCTQPRSSRLLSHLHQRAFQRRERGSVFHMFM